MFIIGILIGLFIGANLGVLIMALCQVSGKADKHPAISEHDAGITG